MLYVLQLMAQQQGGGEGQGGGILQSPIPLFVAMAVLFYFMLLRPARQQEKQRQTMIEAVKKNDEVVTSGGIIGTVVSIKKDKDEAVIESGNTRLRVRKSSIAQVLKAEGAEATAAGDGATGGDAQDERVQRKD
jgi:preprotein translocase subunit YajC